MKAATLKRISDDGNRNPLINRDLEKEELKKHSLTMITGQRYEWINAMRSNVPPWNYPEFDRNQAKAEGGYIQFFEQAFEWENMTYLFYPYFWGRKNNWTVVRSYQDADTLFTKFLQAGAARVLLPVRPGYEEALAYFFATGGNIWNGGDPPAIDDPLFVSIIDELKGASGIEELEEQWESKVPTTLVYLQADAELNP